MSLSDAVNEAFLNLTKTYKVVELTNLELDYIDNFVFNKTAFHLEDEIIKSLWCSYKPERRLTERRKVERRRRNIFISSEGGVERSSRSDPRPLNQF